MNTEKLNKLFDEHGKHFACGFHNLLWQVMVNKVAKDRDVVFYPVHDEAGVILALAERSGGYTPTTCVFNEDLIHSLQAQIAEKLSCEVFGISKDTYIEYLTDSFKKHVKGDN